MGQPISIIQGSSQIQRLEVNGFRVTNAAFPSQLALPSHYHEVACLAVVLEGAVDKIFPRHAYELAAASMVTMPPHERHSDQFAADGAHMLVVEPVEVDEDVLQPCAHLFELIHWASDESIAAIAQRISCELQTPDQISALVVNGLLFELLAAAVRRQRPFITDESAPPPWLKTVHDYLHSYFNQSFQLIDLADEVGIHPVHLSRVFRAHYGMTFGDYVRRLRVEWARHQLAASQEPLAHLAQAAGFADQSHFTRVFKRMIGVTPGQYRRTMTR
jgi:AraC family transcriptional regulator